MKKIIPALALLLISAMVLATSSYAWFTMNATVTASGMKIQATTGGNLLIARTTTASSPADSSYDTKVEITDSATTLTPTSTIDLQTWYKAQAAGVSASAAKSGTYDSISSTAGYVLTEYLWLKSADANGDAYLSGVTVSGVSMGKAAGGDVGYFYDSMRIGVFFDADHYVIYVPDTTGYTADKAGYGEVSGTKSVTAYQKVCTMTASSTSGSYTAAYDKDNNNIGELTAGTGKMATVYIWFEGEDSTCYTNNVNLAEMSIDLTFSCSSIN